MLKESQEPVRELRERIAREVTRLAELERKFEDSYFKKRAQRTASDFREVDLMFLATFDKSTRTPFEEAQGLRFAEVLFQMALSQRRQLEKILATYGPKALAIPS